MNCAATNSKSIGFLTIINNPQHGLFGGYLVLNQLGRPLEFHCTTPIKPNRAQEILYGPTLEAFLYGEQIGQTLLKQSNIEPAMICTDCQPALAVQEYVAWPVVLVLSQDQSVVADPDQKTLRVDGPHGNGPNLLRFDLGRNRLAVSCKAEHHRQAVERSFSELIESFDLSEPFGRIRAAIEEAQQAVR